MIRILLAIMLALGCQFSFGQNDAPKEVTLQILQQLKANIEKQIPAFRKKCSDSDLTVGEIEFAVDTFRIEELARKRMDIDYSTLGRNTAIEALTVSYDKLMNKYYHRLLKMLKPEDQKVLVTAQRAWISFRNAEANLIAAIAKEEYTGGGTIQTTIAVETYHKLVVQRTRAIFNYYDNIRGDQ